VIAVKSGFWIDDFLLKCHQGIDELKRFKGSHGVSLKGTATLEDALALLPSHARPNKKRPHQKNFPDWKVDVIYNGVNAHAFDGWIPDPGSIRRGYAIGPLDPMVLFVGRLTVQKGPDLLVEAIPMILRYYPRTKFVFAGDGDMRGRCEQRATQLGVAHACRFLGWRGGLELVNLYKISDVVCVPSRNEPFGITVLEAWSAGKPVVASQNGGPGEFVWHQVTGLKIYPTPDSIAWGIGTLFTDFEWARWMGQNGRAAAETAFSWDIVADRVLRVYAA